MSAPGTPGPPRTPNTTALPRRLLAVAVGARSADRARAALEQVARVADLAELRLDLIDELDEGDLPRLLRDRPCPVVVTNRPVREGGRCRGSEAERLRPLLQAIELGAEYVDVEHDALHLLAGYLGRAGQRRTRLIVSSHDFAGMPDLPARHRELAALGAELADVVKVVGTARRLLDNLPALATLAQASLPTIAIAMGEAGLLSRVLALRYDACMLTYAALAAAEPVAPGQLSVAAMREVYLAHRIGPATAVHGLLTTAADRPIPAARLAELNRAARAAGEDAVWVPLPALAERGDDPAAVARAFAASGVTVHRGRERTR